MLTINMSHLKEMLPVDGHIDLVTVTLCFD